MSARSKLVAIALALLGATLPAWADEPAIGPGSAHWTWPAYIIVPLIATAVLYGLGVLKMQRRRTSVVPLQIACFAAGWISLLLALDSPMHEISEQLFWVHMSQHEILMLVSAPLLVLSRPLVPFLWVLPTGFRSSVSAVGRSRPFKRTWLAISAPAATWLLSAAALWVWHAPALFSSTLSSDALHAAQHISFLGTALLFWWALLDQHGGRLGYGGALVYVFTTIIHTSVLGALLTFAPRVWYTPYLATAPAWHLTALQDQQIGGLIMWVPAGALLTIIAIVLLVKWLQESERRWEYTRTAALIRASGGGA
jgi:putative membrane protein